MFAFPMAQHVGEGGVARSMSNKNLSCLILFEKLGTREVSMPVQGVMTVTTYLNEKESAQLATAVQWLVRELGFPPEDVDRSYQESLEYFLRQT